MHNHNDARTPCPAGTISPWRRHILYIALLPCLIGCGGAHDLNDRGAIDPLGTIDRPINVQPSATVRFDPAAGFIIECEQRMIEAAPSFDLETQLLYITVPTNLTEEERAQFEKRAERILEDGVNVAFKFTVDPSDLRLLSSEARVENLPVAPAHVAYELRDRAKQTAPRSKFVIRFQLLLGAVRDENRRVEKAEFAVRSHIVHWWDHWEMQNGWGRDELLTRNTLPSSPSSDPYPYTNWLKAPELTVDSNSYRMSVIDNRPYVKFKVSESRGVLDKDTAQRLGTLVRALDPNPVGSKARETIVIAEGWIEPIPDQWDFR